MNKFYQPGEERAAKVGDLFAAIAPRYDLINDLQSFGLHRRWKRALLKMAAVQPGERALDVCCGTGDIALGLHAAGAQVEGLDFSAAMLAVAQKRAEKISSGLQFMQADAMNIPFPDNSFDVVTIGYGLRNLADWARGLEEMKRVARPGGRLLVLDFGKPDNAAWRTLYFAFLKHLVPLFGRIFCRDADTHAYILESLRHYPAQAGVAAKLTALGCEEVRVRQLLGGAMSIHFAKIPASLKISTTVQ
jgi:demethylmenaquinone methyltransferase/2-methoxy-6-polyprenyl-1,4-benzoquinol methylase